MPVRQVLISENVARDLGDCLEALRGSIYSADDVDASSLPVDPERWLRWCNALDYVVREWRELRS